MGVHGGYARAGYETGAAGWNPYLEDHLEPLLDLEERALQELLLLLYLLLLRTKEHHLLLA